MTLSQAAAATKTAATKGASKGAGKGASKGTSKKASKGASPKVTASSLTALATTDAGAGTELGTAQAVASAAPQAQRQTESAAVSALLQAVIDGLEDVKAQDIQVFDTEQMSSLFERIVVASGTSNRQTRALAHSVNDAVRAAGFSKPRLEGAENGEWIVVDCGSVVAHIMQPAIRQYYRLEDLWGEKPIALRTAHAQAASTAINSAVAQKTTTAKAAPRPKKTTN